MSREDQPQWASSPVDLRIDYAGELNPQQLAVVTAGPGPALVIAGAGSGKTRTLIYRVAYLLEHSVPAERILLLTFTNKAAAEMMRRVTDLLGSEWPELWGGTFHSIGARILRRHASAAGYRTDFTILDREDSQDLLKACVKDSPSDVDKETLPGLEVIADIFSLATNTLSSVSDAVFLHYQKLSEFVPWLESLAEQYHARKRASNVMDFDDLLGQWLELLRHQVEVRELYQRRFQFILVDEYQDTNRMQAEIIDLLAARHQNVMAVGDDAQSIYSWRGADFQNILDFPKRYPAAVIHKIETNYRSCPEILSVANAAIAPNRRQFAKTLTAVRPSGVQPYVLACHDAQVQARVVAHRVMELQSEGVPLHRMAVLYRAHFHAFELQLELSRRRIPNIVTSGIRFFEQAHIKDVAATLKFVVNPTDEVAFRRMVRLIPGIGEKSADRAWTAFQEIWMSRALASWNPEGGDSPEVSTSNAAVAIASALQECSKRLPRKVAADWANLSITIAQMGQADVWNKPDRMIRHILEAGYGTYLEKNFPNHSQRREELEHLAGFGVSFEGVEEFLTQLSLLASVEAEDAQAPRDDDGEHLRLSTIHQAKGLEFDVVFLIMLCDGLFPSARSALLEEGLEEERRLFYVAITRARDQLYLSYPLLRKVGNETSQGRLMRSRFLTDLPSNLVREMEIAYVPR